MKTAGVADVLGLANELRARGEELVALAERVNGLCRRADRPAGRRELRHLAGPLRRVVARLDGMFRDDAGRGDDD
jgi:hypothetical protein